MLQHGAYTLLIDACYDRERFPTEEEAIDWCWASTPEEIDSVRYLLSKFFTLDGDIYIQNRIQEEINKYHENAKTNKRIAVEREAKKRDKSTNRERTVNEPPPNQEPITINHKPKKKPNRTLKDFIPPENLNLVSWNEWVSYRKDKNKTISYRRYPHHEHPYNYDQQLPHNHFQSGSYMRAYYR